MHQRLQSDGTNGGNRRPLQQRCSKLSSKLPVGCQSLPVHQNHLPDFFPAMRRWLPMGSPNLHLCFHFPHSRHDWNGVHAHVRV